jgi:hypothetical protein
MENRLRGSAYQHPVELAHPLRRRRRPAGHHQRDAGRPGSLELEFPGGRRREKGRRSLPLLVRAVEAGRADGARQAFAGIVLVVAVLGGPGGGGREGAVEAEGLRPARDGEAARVADAARPLGGRRVAVDRGEEGAPLAAVLGEVARRAAPVAGIGPALRNLAPNSRTLYTVYRKSQKMSISSLPETGQPDKVGAGPVLSPGPHSMGWTRTSSQSRPWSSRKLRRKTAYLCSRLKTPSPTPGDPVARRSQ